MTTDHGVRRAIYPGTFDPPHLGHLDLIERGRALVDELVVAVAVNTAKDAVFSQEERVQLLESCIGHLDGVRVVAFTGLVVELLRQESAQFLLRGIRTFSDFENEYTMALMNRQLSGDLGAETLFVLPSLEFAHFSSRLVKQVAEFGADVGEFLPESVVGPVMERLKRR